jgi:hypothetical protein
MVQIIMLAVYTDQRIDVETLFCEVPRFTYILVALWLTNLWLLCICDALEIHIVCHPIFGIGLVTFYWLASVYALAWTFDPLLLFIPVSRYRLTSS